MMQIAQDLTVTLYDSVEYQKLPAVLKEYYKCDDRASKFCGLLLSINHSYLPLCVGFTVHSTNEITNLTDDFHHAYRLFNPSDQAQLINLFHLLDRFNFLSLEKKIRFIKNNGYNDRFLTRLTKDTFGLLTSQPQVNEFFHYYSNGFYPTPKSSQRALPPFLKSWGVMWDALQPAPDISLRDLFLQRTFNGVYLPFPAETLTDDRIIDFLNPQHR